MHEMRLRMDLLSFPGKKLSEKMKMMQKKVSPFRFSSLLRLQKDPKLALQLFQNPNPNINPDTNPNPKPFRYTLLSYDLIITKLGRAKMFDEMEQILLQLKQETRFSPKEIIFCNVIAFYGRARLSKDAFRVYKEMPSFRCERTVKSLNSLLNALLNCREFDKMWEIFVGIDKYVKDACTYNILINGCCLRDDLDGAWKVFDEMLRKGVRPNVVTFGTLISGFCANSKLDKALRLKEDMIKNFKVEPNRIMYTSLIKGACEVSDLNLAFKLKDEMLKLKLGLDSAVYTTLIRVLFKVGRKAEVFEVLKEMKENGCKPDTATYNAMIAGFCKEKDFEAAYGVLDKMKEKGCKPDVISYNVIIGGLCKERKCREAHDLFVDMPRRGCTPDVVSYRILFDGLCDDMQFKEAAFVLDEMIFKGYAPRIERINKLMDGLCQEGKLDLLWTVLNSLGEGNVVDVETWRMMVSMVYKDDQLSNSSQLLDALIMP